MLRIQDFSKLVIVMVMIWDFGISQFSNDHNRTDQEPDVMTDAWLVFNR